MTQKRYWNTGDPFVAAKARDVHIGLHRKGVYRRYDVTVIAVDTIEIGANGFALLPDGIAVTEDFAVPKRITVLPTTPTEYTVTARHTENNQTGGAAVIYTIEEGNLDNEDISNGIVIAWIHYPGGGVPITQPMVELPPLVGDGVTPGGPAGGDLGGTYPDPTVVGIQTTPVDETAPVEGDVLYLEDGTWGPKPVASLFGSGIPSAVFNVLGTDTDYVIPTNFIDGFREFGTATTIARLTMSQEIAGTSGTSDITLFKISDSGVETQITPNGSLIIPYSSGDMARIVSTSFIPGTNSLGSNDRLGIKVNGLQLNGEDVTVNVIVAAAVPNPIVVSSNTNVTTTVDASVLGNVFTFVGSVWLPASTLLSSDTRLALGTTSPTDTAQFQLRRMVDGAVIWDVMTTGAVASVAPVGNVVIGTTGFYDFYVRSPSSGVALLRGVRLVWSPTTNVEVNNTANEVVLGITPTLVGSIYLPGGSLQGGSQVVLAAYGPGSPFAIFELVDPLGSTVATLTTSGTPGREVISIPPTFLTSAGFYTLRLYGDAATTTSSVHGAHITVIV